MKARNKSREGAVKRLPSTDPIIAAIEAHRQSFMAWATVASPAFAASPPSKALDRITERAHSKFATASLALTTTQPTTLQGVLALFDYVAEYNSGAFRLPAVDNLEWKSHPDTWPLVSGDGVDRDLFPFQLIENARRALARIIYAVGAA